jgi:hypothetical protein
LEGWDRIADEGKLIVFGRQSAGDENRKWKIEIGKRV